MTDIVLREIVVKNLNSEKERGENEHTLEAKEDAALNLTREFRIKGNSDLRKCLVANPLRPSAALLNIESKVLGRLSSLILSLSRLSNLGYLMILLVCTHDTKNILQLLRPIIQIKTIRRQLLSINNHPKQTDTPRTMLNSPPPARQPSLSISLLILLSGSGSAISLLNHSRLQRTAAR